LLYAAVLPGTQQERNLHEEIVVLLRLTQCKVKETIMLKRSRVCFFLIALTFAATVPRMSAADENGCPVTTASDRPFVPPAPYSSYVGSREFLYGSPALWTVVYPDWHVHSGGKLPFFRQGYDWTKEGRPQLKVAARRLDEKGPLVWNSLASSGFIEGKGLEGMFMTTGIDIPASGCWEIAARYVDDQGKIGTLTYTIWVEP
jgi:hypothetical protein